MKPEIVERDRFNIIGIQKDHDAPNFSEALEQWQQLWARGDEIPAINPGCYYGLTMIPTRTRQNNNCQGVFRYMAAQEGADDATVPEGMIRLTLPPQKYARYTYRGPISGFQAFIMNVWAHYLPESGLEAVEAPEIEVYDERFNLESHESEMDYLVPVR